LNRTTLEHEEVLLDHAQLESLSINLKKLVIPSFANCLILF